MILRIFYSDLSARIGEQNARILIQRHTGLEWADIITSPEKIIPEPAVQTIQTAALCLEKGKPLSRLEGVREFWGLDFLLSQATLDPRPDTEVLVERALAHFKDSPPETILDLGTGTGCIAIALLKEWPKAHAVAMDLSLEALQTAQKNAIRHKVQNRMSFVCGFWADSLDSQFDLIVSNPPYIKQAEIADLDVSVKNHDPILALNGGVDGIEPYRKIFDSLPQLLKSNSRAFFEIGSDQADEMMRLGKEYRIRIHSIFPDYAGRARVVDISRGDK